jgi:hypothetical protein
MAAEDVNNLRAAVNRYRTVDDRIRDLNRQVYPLREQRKITELEIVDILRQPQFATVTKLDIREDGSSIKIKKPQMWKTAWSLSKGEMRTLITQYFVSTNAPTAEECYRFITETHDRTLVRDTFSIERVVPGVD